jgi:Tol biopolymer transport system component
MGDRVLLRLTLATGEWNTYPLPVKTWTRIEWNTDGSRYFYARQGFGGDDPAIVERDLQSDRERVVFRGNGGSNESYRGLRLSPDRRSLAIKGIVDSQGIVILDLETGQTRVVYDKAAGETLTSDSPAVPTWSPRETALLVDRTENQRTDRQATDLRLIPVDGGEVRRIPLGAELTRLLSPPGRRAQRPNLHHIDWSPDGGRLAFVLSDSGLETWVIENPLTLAGTLAARSRQ